MDDVSLHQYKYELSDQETKGWYVLLPSNANNENIKEEILWNWTVPMCGQEWLKI